MAMSRIARTGPPKSFLSGNYLLRKDMLWHDLPAGKHLVSSMSNQPMNSSRLNHLLGMSVLNQMNFVSGRTGHSSDLLLRLHCRFFNTRSRRVSLELGAYCIPKDNINKHATDAYLFLPHEQIFGVADGCVHFEKDGCVHFEKDGCVHFEKDGCVHFEKDGSGYSQTLMSNASNIAVLENPNYHNDLPGMILKKAICMTKERGGSTACILALVGQAIIAAQVGNSGFLVIRNGEVAYRSPMLLHYFSSPSYVGPSGSLFVETMKVPVEEGDVIVAATDGLFHNLFDDTIIRITREGMMDNLSPGIVAMDLGEVARAVSHNRTVDTPFWKARREARCTMSRVNCGGKQDDITVIVGNVIGPKFGYDRYL